MNHNKLLTNPGSWVASLILVIAASLPLAVKAADSDHGHNHAQHEGSAPADHDEHGHDEHDDEAEGHGDHSDHENPDDHDSHSDHEDHDEGLDVSPERAAAAGIQLATAGPGRLELTVPLFGRTEPDPQRVSHVSARYPGMIQRVRPALGDAVQAGDEIIRVEANDSLRSYGIKAPIAGTVVQRHANPGEATGSDPLLTIADYSRLWVSLNVFPNDAARIQAGQPVTIRAGARSATGQIVFLTPETGNTPYIVARLPLENAGGRWSPGLLVTAEVTVANEAVPLLIDNRGLQTVEDRPVVFVLHENRFEPAPLTLGRSDGRHTEVLAGLEPGARYVVENSYLLKAELEKSGASHDH